MITLVDKSGLIWGKVMERSSQSDQFNLTFLLETDWQSFKRFLDKHFFAASIGWLETRGASLLIQVASWK